MPPTNSTQRGYNSAANFQALVGPCFSEPRSKRFAWPDDLALFHTFEANPPRVLTTFLRLAANHQLMIFLSQVNIPCP